VTVNDVGDVVLVHFNEHPAFFARVEDIQPDVKPEWYQIRLLVLQVPLKELTWILRAEYIAGQSFTMGGHPVRIEGLPEVGRFTAPPPDMIPEGEKEASPPASSRPSGDRPESPGQSRPAEGDKVISLVDRLKPKGDGPNEVA
jgi:hypothetical protein